MSVLRWILLPVACAASWAAALLLGALAHSFATSLCPPDQMVSGMCVAPWFRSVETGLTCFFSAFAAALIVASAFFIAPAVQQLAGWTVFIVGAVYALWIAFATGAWPEFTAAGIAGLAALLLLVRRQKRSSDHVTTPNA
jgi:hypothetical protein